MKASELKRYADSVGLFLIVEADAFCPRLSNYFFSNGYYGESYSNKKPDNVADYIVNCVPDYFQFPVVSKPVPFDCELDFVHRMALLRDKLITEGGVEANPYYVTYADHLADLNRQLA